MTSTKQSASYNIGQSFSFTVGQKVMCNGYEGRITKVCDGQLTGMVEVRLPGGECCTDASFPDCYPL